MKNGKGNHTKGGNGSVPVSIVKRWFDKTEKILWAIERGQEKERTWAKKMIAKQDERIEESKAETKKLIAKQDQRIEASEKRIEQNEKVVSELKESNKEQRRLNAIFSREILKSHGYTNE